MEKSNFDLLMQRYLNGTASEEERLKIEAWLDVMKTEDNTNLELSREQEEDLFLKITRATTRAEEASSWVPSENKNKYPRTLHMAAALFLLLAASFVIWKFSRPSSDHPGSTLVEKMILADGTLVWVTPGSSLSYFEDRQQGTRHTRFQGSALFEVAKDPAHPFVIQCGKAELRVVGTSFRLSSSTEGLQLAVMTGKVNVVAPAGSTLVTAREELTLTPQIMEKHPLSSREISAITANTEYNMSFRNEAVSEVLHRIERKFNVKVQAEEKVGRCRITADFTDHSLESTLQLISEVLAISYQKRGDTVTITGRGCDK